MPSCWAAATCRPSGARAIAQHGAERSHSCSRSPETTSKTHTAGRDGSRPALSKIWSAAISRFPSVEKTIEIPKQSLIGRRSKAEEVPGRMQSLGFAPEMSHN